MEILLTRRKPFFNKSTNQSSFASKHDHSGPSFRKGRKSKRIRKRRRNLREFCVLLNVVSNVLAWIYVRF